MQSWTGETPVPTRILTQGRCICMNRTLTIGMLLALTITAGAGAYADAPEASGRAFWSVPTVAAVPAPQALLAPDAWPEASALTGFSGLNSHELTRSQPVFWLTRDERALFVAWRVPKLNGKPLVKQVTQRDGAVWAEDAVEIFLDPGHTHRDYFQLIVNANGTQLDAKGRDTGWNAQWDTKVAEDGTAWAGIASIPFASLGATPPGDASVWAVNLVADRSEGQRPVVNGTPEECNATWVDLGQGQTLHDAAHLGHLVFGATAPVRMTELGTPWWRTLAMTVQSAGAHLAVNLTQADGTPEWRAIPFDAPATRKLQPPATLPGDYRLQFDARTDKQPVAFLPMRFHASAMLEPRMLVSALSEKVELSAVFDAPNPPAESRLEAKLVNGAGEAVRTGTLQLTNGLTPRPVAWSFADLPVAAYKLVLQDLARADLRSEQVWNRPAKPAWLGSQAGKFGDDVVMRPWTPLKVTDRGQLKIACWGREYAFGPEGLLASVHTKGTDLLAAPMALDATVAGSAVRWTGLQPKITRKADGAVEFEAQQAGGDLRLSCQGRMEFDGFLKVKLRLEGGSTAGSLDALTLSIPFRKDIAKLMHYFPRPSVWTGIDPRKLNARAVPPEGWAYQFLYHVWVGDEEKGLQWLTETDENWRPADPAKAIELVPEGDRMVLRLHLIGKPTKLDKPREYTFAFQASPVKPIPADYRTWHYSQVASYGLEKQPYLPMMPTRTISYPAEGNIHPDKGTVELTVVPSFESAAPGEENRDLFNVLWPTDNPLEPKAGAWFYWNQDDKGMRVVFREASKYTLIYGGRFDWKPGEAHTVAFTWGETKGIFVDGKRVAEQPAGPMLSPSVSLKDAVIQLGGRKCDFAVRQVRVSGAIRPAEALGVGAAPMEADAQTLLLDRFESVSGAGAQRRSQPVKITGGTGAAGAAGASGVVTPAVTTVAGGVSLANPPSTATTLDHFKQLDLKYLGFHEHWSDWQGFPRTSHTEELKSLIAGCRAKDLKLLLYHAWQMSDTAPEYPLYLRECEVIFPDRFIYTREPKQTDYPICQRSAWPDFMADGLQRLFKEYGPDGIYSDGLSYPTECSNALHGCGYVGEDGVRHPTYTLFATREAMKRFRYILEQQGKPTLFVCHTSGSITLPTLAFCDAYLDAEHLTSQPRPFRLPREAFRAEFMGHNFGIPAYFLTYDWNGGMTSKEGLALSLLHDTELPWAMDDMVPVWKAWKEFHVEQARFLPYWGDTKGWLVGAPKGVLVSAYVKPNGEKLVVVVNTTETDIEGVVRLKGRVEAASDALTGAKVAVRNGAMAGKLAPWRLNLWRVE